MNTKLLEAPAPVGAEGLRVPTGVVGTGMYLPARIVTNADLAATLDTSNDWIIRKTGIRQRRFLEPEENTSDMCVKAARQALENAGVSAGELDALIVSTFTFDQLLPSTALIVKEALGADRAVPLDINQAACAGGVYGLWLGSHLLQNERASYVLVIGAECLSRVTDPRDRATRVFFGDAAGAAVLGQVAEGYGLLSCDFGSSLSYCVEIPAGGSKRPTGPHTVADRSHFLKMEGREVLREAVAHLPETITNAVRRARSELGEVQHFFIHQANLNILKQVMKALGCPIERATINVDRYGNTGAATVFTVLHEAMDRGDVRHGDLFVISGIGAGFLWGSICMRHHATT
ncbi:3-oxoacyl-ACP synthase III family protein [Rubrobacter radiotolerans]|uniref:Ketoacyl-ACP synthase III n=1 Tax=Rubrobacter radiotolerans TaxID=42256 RepID=A0AB35T6K2_RUBRA|nr:ketoacyl-ACP synthase III [Rubrobacter radiotolerans]MDX5895315.1 ketoacyl-ACP synthase III [Rubrobacter radiotolerans]SMC01627.1 3-oxoacyl-[acyl-carrier-protein] synthase-3 [Rubrobacter radiotolerans DSM 5868]